MGNYASRFYVHAMVTVRAVQRRLESELNAQVDAMETQLLTWLHSQPDTASASVREKVVTEVTKKVQTLGDYVSTTWRDLLPELITTYRDGYIISGQDEVYVSINKMFYPKWWLEKVGYFAHSGNPEAQNDDPNNWIYFSSGPNGAGAGSSAAWMALGLLTVLLSGGLGYFLGQQHASKKLVVQPNSSFSLGQASSKLSVRTSSSSFSSPYRLVSREDDDDNLLDDQERAIFTLNKKIIQGQQRHQSGRKSGSRLTMGDKEQEMTSLSYQSL